MNTIMHLQFDCHSLTFLIFKKNIYLAVTGLSCGMQVLVPRPRIDPGPPALEGQSPSHWTISKSQEICYAYVQCKSIL